MPAHSDPRKARRLARAALLLAAVLIATPARGAELRLGLAVETDTLDPHFHYFGGALALTSQIFDPLVATDADGALQPALAAAWRAVGDAAWEFDLRPGVRFSDGTPLTAEDVAFTYARARDVPRSPAGFGPSLRSVSSVEAVGPATVRVHTNGPAPLLPVYLSNIGIVSKAAGASATTDTYNSGVAAIGTGPYAFVSWARGDNVVLRRNPAYWGPAPAWDSVRFRVIANPAARVAALLAGDVDLVNEVPIEDAAVIKRNPAFRLREATSNNVIAFQLDVARRKPPFARANDGAELAENPLADLRVRRALALAINRDQLRDRVMNGQAAVADQIMAPGRFGYAAGAAAPPPDPAKARQLLAEAGYPEGFRLTMQCQSDRYANGSVLCQAVAQMLTRVGIKAEPVPVPHAIFITHANKHEYSLFTAYMLVDTGEPSATMLATFATQGPARGMFNRGQYSNPEFDALVDASQTQIDPAQRERTLGRATAILQDEVVVIPVLRPLNIEAMRTGLDHAPRGDGVVAAAAIRPAAPGN